MILIDSNERLPLIQIRDKHFFGNTLSAAPKIDSEVGNGSASVAVARKPTSLLLEDSMKSRFRK